MTKEPLVPAEILRISNGEPESLIDKRKPSFKAFGLGKEPLTEAEAIDLIRKEPSIIRRPIFEIDGEIVFGYDKERLRELLG